MPTVVVHATPRPVQYIDPNSDLLRKKDPIFAAKPVAKDFTGATNYLTLCFPSDVVDALIAKLKTGKVTQARANDILRASRLHPVDDSDPGVKKEIGNIKDEVTLPPVFLIQGDLFRGIPLIVADGYHRVSACYLRDPDAMVSCVLAVVDWSALESPRANG
jgi:hypothetical protein